MGPCEAPPVSVHVPFPAARRARNKYWNPLHVTMRAVGGLPSFRAQTLFAAFERAVRRTRREDFRIVEFSVQDDHLHLIVEADDKTALSRGMKSFSVRANRLFNAALGPSCARSGRNTASSTGERPRMAS